MESSQSESAKVAIAERRLRDHAAKGAAQPWWIGLAQYHAIRQLVKSNRSGSHDCACGARIARNKPRCRACATTADVVIST